MNCHDQCSFWKLNKFLLICFGLWPYQSKRSEFYSYLILGVSMLSCLIPLVRGFSEEKDTDIIVYFESIVSAVTMTGGVALCAGLRYHMDRIKRLYDHITNDWKMITEPDEMAILKRYSLQGKRLIIIYIGTFSGSVIWFFSLTYIPLILNKGVNATYLKFPLYSKHWIINERFYTLQVLLHEHLGIFYVMFTYIATTGMFISSVSHICGMFEIVCYRLRKLTDNVTLQGNKVVDDAKVINDLLSIIAKHKEAIKSVRIISSLFGPTFFIVEICILLTLALLIFDFNYNIDRSILLTARINFIALIFAEYLFYLNYGGQLIIEYSNKVLTSTYFTKWYLLSKDARRMLMMILLRSSRGDLLNAGTMTLSLENFTKIIKFSWSCACVLMSSQKKYKMNGSQ